MEQESQYWRRLVKELQSAGVTAERIAEHLDVSVRSVSHWKCGRRPTGWLALKLVKLHAERTGNELKHV